MADIDNNRLMGLLIILGGRLLLRKQKNEDNGCLLGKEKEIVNLENN